MSFNPKPIGRGAILRMLQEESEKAKVTAETSVSLTKCSGEGSSFLQKSSGDASSFLHKSTTDESTVDKLKVSSKIGDSGIGTFSPTFAGRGRSISFGAAFSEISISSSEKISSKCDPVKKPISGRGSLLLASVRRESKLNVQEQKPIIEQVETIETEYEEPEKEPVIRRGAKGVPINISTNYIRLKTDANKGVYEYEVRFTPDVHSMQLRHHLISQLSDVIGKTKTFDGVTLYLPIKLDENNKVLPIKEANTGNEFNVRIKYKKQKSLKDCIHLYNVLFDRVMNHLKFVRFGRKKFDPTAPKIIPQHKLEIWPGYVTAIDEYEDGVMLCLDVSHRLLCQETVLDVLRHAYLSDKSNFEQNSLQALLGCVVLTRYNNRTYRIDDISFDASPENTFLMNGTNVTYSEYYRKHYNIIIHDLKQPLLIHREERRVSGKTEKESLTFCLIPELCYMTGITDAMRSDQKVMRDIATVTRVTPNQRVDSMRKFCENLTKCESAAAVLSNWGLKLDTEPLKLKGRQMDDENIIFGRGKTFRAEKGDFNKYCCNNELYKVVDLNNWLVIHTKRDVKFANIFIEMMEKNSSPMGLKVCSPKVQCLNDDKNETYVQTLRQVVNSTLQIIVILCPTSRDDRYAAIKKVCCSELPIPTQVINSSTLSKEDKRRGIIGKIALQMNCKMGGSLWSVKIPFTNVMICGIDTYHDTKKKDNSVGAFVASMNGVYTEWYSRAVIQQQKEELINGLCQSLINALSAYKHRNNVLPDKIIIFRDGVGDGQLTVVSQYEIPQLLKACSLKNPDYAPLFTFIVVQKNINTRIFAMRNNGMENPLPGCVLDHTITRRFMYDFFLVPQNVRQGTVSPTHYIVLFDGSNFAPDVLQRLSYKLCFLYYNWPGTVRVPACCQYAHKLAFLVGQSIKKQPSEMLSERLYYL